VGALKAHGACEVFSIPGDFVLPFCKLIEESGTLPFYTLSHGPAMGRRMRLRGSAARLRSPRRSDHAYLEPLWQNMGTLNGWHSKNSDTREARRRKKSRIYANRSTLSRVVHMYPNRTENPCVECSIHSLPTS
jgi:hypothetical protein